MLGFIELRIARVWQCLKRLRHSILLLGLGPWTLNFIVQRVFRVNGDAPWMVHYTSRVILPHRISIGQEVWISLAVSGSCYLQGGNGISIGDGTKFAPGVKIISANHNPTSLAEWVPASPIVIGQGCWIGANATILPGVELGDRCVVGAGAVVTKSFCSDCSIVGVPARSVQEEGSNEKKS